LRKARLVPNPKPLALPAALFALALVGPSAAAGESDALRFNNAFARFNQDLASAGKKFGEALAPALQGKAVSLPEVRKRYKNVQKVLADVKKAASALKVPDSESARKFARTYDRFLKGQEEFIKKEFQELLSLVEGSNPPDQQVRARLRKILQQVGEREATTLREVQQAQEAFAKEHGIKLEPAQP
jgi:hypothetical protein